ncbi:MAG: ATP-dependent Clp protease proteolytic subunit [Paludibacteraceae bacterium]|nr:ATP-dependent Clp protease proteolytic subunit [Paludibacteraceae bacterium]MCK9615962.1 ATP-dependent Clp protease proteolytic subunit [Candidatus Omnitrophota bacterium]
MPKEEEEEEIIMPQFVLPQSDYLTRSRIIYFNTEFNQTSARSCIERLLIMDAESIHDDITLLIDSNGGDVYSFFAIYDSITKLIHCDVATVCLGRAMSCGQMLLMSGTKGKRFITENSNVMMHQISSGTIGKISEMENHVQMVQNLMKRFEKIILKHSKIKKNELSRLMSRDAYMSPEEVIKYGICDHLITKPSDLYSRLVSKNIKTRNVIDKMVNESKIKRA